jgi:hypothetical protein
VHSNLWTQQAFPIDLQEKSVKKAGVGSPQQSTSRFGVGGDDEASDNQEERRIDEKNVVDEVQTRAAITKFEEDSAYTRRSDPAPDSKSKPALASQNATDVEAGICKLFKSGETSVRS